MEQYGIHYHFMVLWYVFHGNPCSLVLWVKGLEFDQENSVLRSCAQVTILTSIFATGWLIFDAFTFLESRKTTNHLEFKNVILHLTVSSISTFKRKCEFIKPN